jgi:hypothetical protein
MKPECTVTIKAKLIIFSENTSKLTLVNRDQVKAIKVFVDGCEITVGLKCDFLLIAKNIEHFIELKGHDIGHAIKQIKTTMEALSKDVQLQKKISYIICRRSPLSSASIQNIQVKFKKNYNSTLIIKSSPFKTNI